jgi:UDP-3-O-[3-hydroxymyristoyl] N-acetylglucosamine deacetylase
VGYRIYGSLHAIKSGHQVNNLFARKLLESVNAYSLIEADDCLRGYGYLGI